MPICEAVTTCPQSGDILHLHEFLAELRRYQFGTLSPDFYVYEGPDKRALKFVDDNGEPCTDPVSKCDKADKGLLPISFTSLYADKLVNNNAYVDLLEDTQQKAKDSPIDAFPSGIPYKYWQQYIGLKELIIPRRVCAPRGIYVLSHSSSRCRRICHR